MIDWKAILPANAKVCFADPKFGEFPWRHEDHLLVAFPNDVHLEIQWDHDKDMFVVHVTADHFHRQLKCEFCSTADEAVELAIKLAGDGNF